MTHTHDVYAYSCVCVFVFLCVCALWVCVRCVRVRVDIHEYKTGEEESFQVTTNGVRTYSSSEPAAEAVL